MMSQSAPLLARMVLRSAGRGTRYLGDPPSRLTRKTSLELGVKHDVDRWQGQGLDSSGYGGFPLSARTTPMLHLHRSALKV